MKNIRTVALSCLGVTVSMLTLAACTAPADTSGELVTDGTFTSALAEDPGTLNPLMTNLSSAVQVGAFAYDTLLYFDPVTGEPHPYLAETWTDSPDSVSFTLRDDITCADGTPFTAETAAANFEWILDEANGSPLRDSIVPSAAEVSVEGNTLTVDMPQAYSFLLFNIGSQQLACQGAIDDPDSVVSASNGTGLYEVTEVATGDKITLTRRDGYTWAPDGTTTSQTPGLPKNVVFRILTNQSTAANLLLSGEVNAAVITGPDEARLAELDTVKSPIQNGQLLFNHYAGKATAEADVRNALVEGIDLDTLMRIVTAEKGYRATSLLGMTPSPCVYDSISGNIPSFDADAAAASLDAAGWEAGADGVRAKDGKPLAITLTYVNSVDPVSAAAEYLQKQWQELGAVVTLDGGDMNYALSKVFAPEDDLTGWDVALGLNLMTNIPTIFPPYLSGPVPPEGTNFSSIDNPAYDAAVLEAQALTGEESCAQWAEAEAALFQNMDLLPVSLVDNMTYLSGADSLLPPSGGGLTPAGIRLLG